MSKYIINGAIVKEVCCTSKPYYTTSYTCLDTKTSQRTVTMDWTELSTQAITTSWLSSMSTYLRSTTGYYSTDMHETFTVKYKIKSTKTVSATIDCTCDCHCGCNDCDCVKPVSRMEGYVTSKFYDRYKETSTINSNETKTSKYTASYSTEDVTMSTTTTYTHTYNKNKVYSTTTQSPEDYKQIDSTYDITKYSTILSSTVFISTWITQTGSKSSETESRSTTTTERITTNKTTPITSISWYTEPKEVNKTYWTTSSETREIWYTNVTTSLRTIEGEPVISEIITYPKI